MDTEEEKRLDMLLFMMQQLALSGGTCDVATYSGPVYLSVTLDPEFFYAWMYGAGVKKMAEIFNRIKFSRINLKRAGETDAIVSLNDIWMIYPMPKDGFTEAKLAAVDLKDADRKVEPSGKTVKEIIRETYRPKDDKELEYFLRRYLSS